jgi:hypothetical protein
MYVLGLCFSPTAVYDFSRRRAGNDPRDVVEQETQVDHRQTDGLTSHRRVTDAEPSGFLARLSLLSVSFLRQYGETQSYSDQCS